MNKPLDGLVEGETQAANSPSEPDIIIGSREQLFYLLAEASEIEHTLMCNYLYAVFSLKAGSASNLSERESKAVLGWQKMMMSVAIEEMGHLLIVANLTSALGGLPHFSRPNFPVKPGYFPSGVVLKLTPFNQKTLDHLFFLRDPWVATYKMLRGLMTLILIENNAIKGLCQALRIMRRSAIYTRLSALIS